MKPAKTFDKEAVKLNLARLKKGGEVFEVIIDPDKVIEFKGGRIKDFREVLRYTKVFSDAKKGLAASEAVMKTVFGTDNEVDVAGIILREGEIQFTQEYREQQRQEKMKRIVDIIARNAIDPRTHLPHPRNRIEAAFEEARIRVDEIKDAESQVNDIVVKLRPILPIRFATKEIQARFGSQFAPKAYAAVERMGKIKSDSWGTDGSWTCVVEIPAGLQNEFFDALNRLTHGEVETTILGEK